MNVAKRNGWDIIIPSKVHSEVISGGQPDNIILDGIQKGSISISYAHPTTFSTFMNMYTNLGNGELEAISIAYDSGVHQYLILSDDNLATKRANKLGIPSLGILAFMVLANRQGLLSKKKQPDT
jgi:predicted nucleic acid-binding protein